MNEMAPLAPKYHRKYILLYQDLRLNDHLFRNNYLLESYRIPLVLSFGLLRIISKVVAED